MRTQKEMMLLNSPVTAACAVLVIAATAAFAGIESRLHLPDAYESRRVSYRATIDQAKETEVARMDGAGCLRHLWMTIASVREKPENGLAITLRIYFDGSRVPAVETPAAPFFGIHQGHAARYLNSPFLQVTERAGFNAYFSMPYAKGMRVTLQNGSKDPLIVWFQADYHQYEAASFREPMRFHAVYRRVNPAQGYGKPFHLGHAEGQGFIAGASIGIRVFDRRDWWFHNGGELILLDGRRNTAHLLHGIGGEDFFGTAWGQEVFSNGCVGTPYYDENPKPKEGEPQTWFAAYRFFEKDTIDFKDSFSFDYGTLANDMSGVLYWYQKGTAKPIVRLPAYADRMASAPVPDGKYDIDFPPGREWRLCGPFSAATAAEFEHAEFPESGLIADQSQPAEFGQYAAAVKQKLAQPFSSRWIADPVRSIFNFVDLTRYFRPRLKTNAGFPVDVSAYAYTTVASPAAVARIMRIGHDDPLRVWHNGKLVYNGAAKNGFRTVEIPVELARGENRFLLKVANGDNMNYRAWVFLFDLLPAERTPKPRP